MLPESFMKCLLYCMHGAALAQKCFSQKCHGIAVICSDLYTHIHLSASETQIQMNERYNDVN